MASGTLLLDPVPPAFDAVATQVCCPIPTSASVVAAVTDEPGFVAPLHVPNEPQLMTMLEGAFVALQASGMPAPDVTVVTDVTDVLLLTAKLTTGG
jgi:hypothetical protein